MIEKKFYLTKQETDTIWSFVGDPLRPNTTLDTGLITVNREDIRVDQFGAYVIKFQDK